jgi:hypothetical protein
MRKTIKANRGNRVAQSPNNYRYGDDDNVDEVSSEWSKQDVVDEFNTQIMAPDSELRTLLSGRVDDSLLDEALAAAMQAFNETILG